MVLEWRESALFFKEGSCFFPSFFSLVGLVHHILIDGYFFLIEKGLKLFIDEVDKISRKLSGNIDEFKHLSFFAHSYGSSFIE